MRSSYQPKPKRTGKDRRLSAIMWAGTAPLDRIRDEAWVRSACGGDARIMAEIRPRIAERLAREGQPA